MHYSNKYHYAFLLWKDYQYWGCKFISSLCLTARDKILNIDVWKIPVSNVTLTLINQTNKTLTPFLTSQICLYLSASWPILYVSSYRPSGKKRIGLCSQNAGSSLYQIRLQPIWLVPDPGFTEGDGNLKEGRGLTYYYRLPTKLQEGKVFTPVCLFTEGGMMSLPLWSHVLSRDVIPLPVWSNVLSRGRVGVCFQLDRYWFLVALCILLECILVRHNFYQELHENEKKDWQGALPSRIVDDGSLVRIKRSMK